MKISPSYAESAAFSGITSDGATEISIRLARFPGSRTGSLWAGIFLGKGALGAHIQNLDLGDFLGATPVEEDHVRFEVRGQTSGCLERWGLESEFRGKAEASVLVHASAHPPEGVGGQPLRIQAEFQAWHRAFTSRGGRTEVMGRVTATIETPGETRRIEGVGGWHEQVGERPTFGAPFTYMKVMGDRRGLLASLRYTGRTWGYAFVEDQIIRVRSFEIEPRQETRKFRFVLENGRSIAGQAERIRDHSVPVEGQRRPGSSVRVRSDVGTMIGQLNDWFPSSQDHEKIH